MAFAHDVHSGNDFHDNEPTKNRGDQVEVPDTENAQDAVEEAKSVPASSGPNEDDIYSSGDPVDQAEVGGAGGGSAGSVQGSSEPATSLDSTDVNTSGSTDNGSQSSSQSVQNVAAWGVNYDNVYGLIGTREPSDEVPFTAHNQGSYINSLATSITHVAGIAEGEEEQEQEQEQHEASVVAPPPRHQYDDDWYPYNPHRDSDDDVGW